MPYDAGEYNYMLVLAIKSMVLAGLWFKTFYGVEVDY